MIYSIIVFYNPTVESIPNLKAILMQSDKVIVVDNSTKILSNEFLTVIEDNSKILYLSNGGNIGLSIALNIGIKKALQFEECNYIVLFDQDSLPSPNFNISLLNTYHKLKKTDIQVGAVGGTVIDPKKNNEEILSRSEAKEVDVVITSGCFISADVLRKVGLMDETFFIDYIDYEWCFRAKGFGYKIYLSQNSFLHHNLGDNLVVFLNFKKPIHTNVQRHYHITRNQLVILCRSYIPLEWRFFHFFKFFYRIPGYILYSSDRKKTAGYIFKGIVDFVRLDNKRKYIY